VRDAVRAILVGGGGKAAPTKTSAEKLKFMFALFGEAFFWFPRDQRDDTLHATRCMWGGGHTESTSSLLRMTCIGAAPPPAHLSVSRDTR